jgi:hypothetical protein
MGLALPIIGPIIWLPQVLFYAAHTFLVSEELSFSDQSR